MITNKELIHRLVEYYLTQDPAIVAKTLAGLQIDINRLCNFCDLNEKEADCLTERIRHNNKELQNFYLNGPSGPMGCSSVENWFEVPDEGEGAEEMEG